MKRHLHWTLLALAFPLLLPAAPPRQAVQAAPQLSEAACRAWATQLEQTLSLGDKAFFVASFNNRSLALRILGKTQVPPAARENAITQLKAVAAKMGDSICDALKGDGNYKLLAVRTSGTHRTALFRMVGAGGLNYHEFLLEPGPKGSVEAVDVYVALTGEWMSQTLGRIMGTVMDTAQVSEPAARRLVGTINAYKGHMEKGQKDLALKDLESLPAGWQKEKWVLLTMIQCTDKQKDLRAYEALLERFRQAYPNDAAAGLLSLDYYFLRKNYDETVRVLDRLKPAMANDPYLDLLAGTMLYTKGDMEAAVPRLDLAVAGDPSLRAAYEMKAVAVLTLKRYADAVATFKVMEEKFGYQVPDMTNNPRFAGFVKSPEYGAWKQPKEEAKP